MKILLSAPEHAVYLGSEHADGSIEEEIFDAVDAAIEPAFYRDEEGVRHYFDLL